MLRHLASVAVISVLMGAAQAQPTLDGLRFFSRSDRGAIQKLAQMTAADHSTIVFTVYDMDLGYATDGSVGSIRGQHQWLGRCDRMTHAGLSHDGARVAYVTDGEQEGEPLHHNCRIVIYDLASGAGRTLIALRDDPGELFWSWDDSRIVYASRSGAELSEVSVASGESRTIHRDIDGRWFSWFPVQWLHNGRDLVFGRSHEVPTGKPNEYTTQFDLFRLAGGEVQPIGPGGAPSVSPQSDRIAYFDDPFLMMMNADGTGKQSFVKARHAGEFKGPIVWSSDGGRLLYCTGYEDAASGDLILLNIASGKSTAVLRDSGICVQGWY